MGRTPKGKTRKTSAKNKKGVLTAQELLENEPLRVGTPLSGSVGRIRRWMLPA
jgi:hypothetical protein